MRTATGTRAPWCWPAATTACPTSDLRPSRSAVRRSAENRRRPGPPPPAACRATAAPRGAHPAARAGSGSPRALHPPMREAGIGYCLDSSRLSKVVRVASIHYSPWLSGNFPPEPRGESVRLRDADTRLAARLLVSRTGRLSRAPHPRHAFVFVARVGLAKAKARQPPLHLGCPQKSWILPQPLSSPRPLNRAAPQAQPHIRRRPARPESAAPDGSRCRRQASESGRPPAPPRRPHRWPG